MAQRIHETIIMIRIRLGALFLLIGSIITKHRSKLITTVIYVDKLNAKIWANFTALHIKSPAYHCTVAAHIASEPIQKKVTSKSAVARLMISVLIVDFRRLIRYIWTIVDRLPNRDKKNIVPFTSRFTRFISSNTGKGGPVIFGPVVTSDVLTLVDLFISMFTNSQNNDERRR